MTTMTTSKITDLLTAQGFAPRLTFGGFAAAVWLAEAVSQTIATETLKEQFLARSVAELARLDYQPFEGLEDWAKGLAETAEEQRPTPLGSTEFWGSLLQLVKA